MIPRAHDHFLREVLDPPAPPAGFPERALRAVRERNTRGDLALRFDIAASSRGLARLRPGTGRTYADSWRARSLAGEAREELAEYLRGQRSFFTVPVDLSAVAPFQRAVLEATATIPFGEVRSYRWIAERIGSATAVRAVGTALGRNPVSIVVPCHRVLRADGSLGGYALGLELKTRLLGLERETPTLVGTDTTRIVCRRGCPDEQRIGERHRVVFSSLREARGAGYRACRRCQPAKA
jgi:O-6-methylguanine DNA methyltransferase